ncbi:MAG TPA: CehA/McbA family metallohydrolase [bacterium]|nr:CehA/McbA family metallohydrolase [bacterium]
MLPVAPRPARPAAVALAAAAVLCASPAAAQYTLYYGNLHSHCNLSDDATQPPSGPPATAFTYARDTAGIDILALTDHSHYLSTSDYNTLKAEADNFTQNGVFVGLAGQEHGSLSSSVNGAFGHMNVYEAASVINQGTYRYNLTATYGFLASNVDRVTGAPLAGSFNHPYSGAGAGAAAQFYDFAYDSTGDLAIQQIEVINGKRSSAYESEYFQTLANGWHVGALGNQDNHDGAWGDQPNNLGNIPLTGVWAVALTKADVLEAIRSRRTFAMEVEPSTDRFSLKVTADGNWMGTSYSTAADSVEIIVEASASTNLASFALYRNGTLIRTTGASGTSDTWTVYDTPGPGDFYYVVRVNQADGDRAWASPIWVNSTSNFVLPIATVNQDAADGTPTMWFQTATVQGLVTVDTDTLNTTQNEVFIQDDSGGLMILDFGGQGTPVVAGDNVVVSGTIDTFQGQTMISAPTINIVGTGGGEPAAQVITTNDIAVNGETYEGSIVEIREVSITGGTWPPPGMDGSVTIDDGSGPATLLIDKDTVLDNQGAPAESTFSVRGIATQRDGAYPYTCCWVLLPRYSTDIFQYAPTGVIELPAHESASATALLPNSPNPFRPRTTIRFDLAGIGSQPVRVDVFDVAGRKVATLADDRLPPGSYELEWNGRSDAGENVAAGVYFLRLTTPSTKVSRKMVKLD